MRNVGQNKVFEFYTEILSHMVAADRLVHFLYTLNIPTPASFCENLYSKRFFFNNKYFWLRNCCKR